MKTTRVHPDKWQRITELFLAAVDLDVADRRSMLDEACRDDPAMRHELEQILASHDAEQVEPIFQASPLQTFVEQRGTDELIGHQLGTYEIVRSLAEGGMSRVYLGRRTSGYEQEVAIKLLRPGLDTADVLGRFHQEIELLAALYEHPSIAGLYDAGALDGRPYFVMEYVRGQWITKYCDANQLALRERLKLFAGVCGAVAAAHRHAIIHRDLKPSNILVTDEGLPKLIDFGIAKLQTVDPGADSGELTEEGSRPLTPDYASPEQVAGGAVTTASDVYSLGIVLYELLSGCRPYRVGSAAMAEIVDTVCHQTIDRPSLALQKLIAGDDDAQQCAAALAQAREQTPESLSRALSGDLDKIVLMCVHKERDGRYSSVEQIAREIERYLNGFPIRARGDALGYRLGKFVRRNRTAVTLASTALLALVVGTLGTTTQAIRASKHARNAALEADRANREATAARAVSDYLARVVETVAPYRLAGFQIGSVGADRVPIARTEALAENAALVRSDLGQHPLVQARLLEAIGRAYGGLGMFSDADPLLLQAAQLRDEHLPGHHLDVANSAESLGWVTFVQGRFRDSVEHWRRALDIRQAQLGDDHPETDLTKFSLATVLGFAERHYSEADALFAEVLQWREENLGPDHVDTGYALLGSGLFRLQADAGRPEQQAALTMTARAGAIFADHAATQPIATVISDVGQSLMLSSLASKEDALAAAERAFNTARSLLGRHHPLVDFVGLLAANELLRQGNRDEAVHMYRDALADLRARGLENSYFAGRNHEHWGHASLDHDETEQHLRRALAIYEDVLGHRAWRTAWCQAHLALTIHAQGRSDEAHEMLDDARQTFLQIRNEGRDTVTWIDGRIRNLQNR